MATWGVASAKAQFSEVVERAMTEGPQRVTKSGRDAVVVVSAKAWDERTKPTQSAADFFLNSPLRGSGLNIRRLKGKFRPVVF